MFGRDNGINIVPEIVGPGHNYAAIHAMEKRFENTQDATYRLIDPEADASLEASVQVLDLYIIDNNNLKGRVSW